MTVYFKFSLFFILRKYCQIPEMVRDILKTRTDMTPTMLFSTLTDIFVIIFTVKCQKYEKL